MPTFATIVPILVSVISVVATALMYRATYRQKTEHDERVDAINARAESIEGEAVFRKDILEQMRAAQSDNSRLRADLFDCQKSQLDMRSTVEEVVKLRADIVNLRAEILVLNRIVKLSSERS